jgi:predicted transcriptional regulator
VNELKIKISEVKQRPDLYPRIEHNQQKAQEYANNIENLPAIELNQYNELIDGKHRLTAHLLKNIDEISYFVTETKNEAEFFALAIKRNALHGVSFTERDRKKSAIKLYNGGIGFNKEDIAKLLSISQRSVNTYLTDIDKQIREERRELIQDMYLNCYTSEEISMTIGVSRKSIDEEIMTFGAFGNSSKTAQSANFQNDFNIPIYNVWTFGKTTNKTEHFGQTEQRILENLLYLYTEPFDIVVDPFGGGGSTLDVCVERKRRCWISDRKPKPGLENKLRTLDITKDMPRLNKRWADVSLTYLDPPYWKQAKGKYSQDNEDLANYESADEFHLAMAKIIKNIAAKQSKGVIALIIQPTQWKSNNKLFTDHVFEITKLVNSKNLVLENRVSCPYSTEQCTPQMVNWAKENKNLLVLSRELVIWKIM